MKWSTFRLSLMLVFVALVVMVVVHFNPTAQYSLEKGSPHLRESEQVFAQDIREFGGTRAYERFATAVAAFGIDDQHAYAHQFGHALYSVAGEKGISVCDARFGLGCFHQFLGDAIGDLGTDAVPRLYAECSKAAGTADLCQHGLGHGVVSGIGYTESDLNTALTLCDSVTKEQTYSGCYGGVFMEYNLRTIASAEGIMGARAPSNGSLYEPCATFDGQARRACTFWLPEWWFFSVLAQQPKPSPESDVKDGLYARMGTLCAQSPEPQSCYEGIGYITPTAFAFDPIPGRTACDYVGTQGHGATYCRGMAGLIYNITAGEQYKAPTMCAGLDEEEQSLCMEYASQTKGFSFSASEMQ